MFSRRYRQAFLIAFSQLHPLHSALFVTDEPWRDFSFTSQTAARLRMRRGRTALASKPRGLMLLKLPASSGKTGAMRAGITEQTLLMNGGQIGEQVRGFGHFRWL